MGQAGVVSTGDEFAYTTSIGPGPAIARRNVIVERGWPPAEAWSRDGVRFFTIKR